MYRPLLIIGALIPSVALAQTFVSDPLSDDYPNSTLAVKLEKLFKIPSSGSNPVTRIVTLREPDDGSGRLFVADHRGKLWVWTGSGSPTEFVDLADEFNYFRNSPGLGTGFNSFDFHPEFATNGKFYTSHNEYNQGGTPDVTLKGGVNPLFQGVITEWTVNEISANTWSGTRRELLRVEIVGNIHGIQEISFNKSAKSGDDDYGLLYICHGEGGAYNTGNTQVAYSLDTFHGGSVLRIDPMGTNGRTGEYGIPADNPWANDGDENTWGEIYAWGFRNPHRISWDLGGEHTMLLGDIGETNIEEINIIEPGQHYGFPYREGTFLFKWDLGVTDRDNVYTLPANDDQFDYVYPAIQYDHWSPNRVHDWTGICGGFVYRGSDIPSLFGQYIFGEITNGEIYHAPIQDMIDAEDPIWFHKLRLYDGDDTQKTLLQMVLQSTGGNRSDLKFGQDLSGEIYVLTKRDGWIRKMVASTEEGDTQWGPYTIQFGDGIYWADTGDFIGSVYLNYASVGWVFSYSLDGWIYLPEANLNEDTGAWTYFPK